MTIDGVWKVEMHGPWGWEARATAFLENGNYRGASTDHFTIGTYSIDGNTVTAEATVNTYGQLGAVLGMTEPRIKLSMSGEIDTESMTVNGKATETEGLLAVELRMTKLADL
jgi:hypothetical protein